MFTVMGMTRSRNNWAFGGVLAVVAVAAIGMLLFGATIRDLWLQGVVKDVAVAILLAVAITALWRLRGNRMFAQEVLELQNVGESVQNWGVRELSMDWESVPWKDLFGFASRIDIVQGYGYTWSSGSRQAALEDFAAKKGRRLRVALPDPANEQVMDALAKRFYTTKEVVRERVLEATRRYQSLRKKGGADIRVYYRDGEPVYAGYLFDSDLVVTLYTHRKAKVADVPVIRVRGGDLVEFVKDDFEEIFRIGTEVPLQEEAS